MSIVPLEKPCNAFVTLLLNDNYLPGALVLAESLKATETTTPLVILYVKSALSDEVYEEITTSGAFDRAIAIDGDVLRSRNRFELDHLLKRTELSLTMSKLNIWRLIDYTTVVYLDSDTLVMDSLDELFNRQLAIGEISAASDAGWPDIFNSGVFVTKPDFGVYEKLLKFYETEDSFDGADQGILNEFFNLQSEKFGTHWDRLPFVYNCTLNSNYEYLPAMIRFKNDIKVFHFIGRGKPWVDRALSCSNSNYPKIFGGDCNLNLFQLWWRVYDKLTDNSTRILEISGNLQSRFEPRFPINEALINDDGVDLTAGPIDEPVSSGDSKSQIDPNTGVINNKLDDVSTIHFPMYYYKHNSAEPIVDESSKGEAWKLQESKIEWHNDDTQQKQHHRTPDIIIDYGNANEAEVDHKYEAHVEAINNYVKNNPIFPWEGKTLNKKPNRTFDNLNRFEPPSYSIAIMDSSSSASSFNGSGESDDEDGVNGQGEDKLMGFNNGYKFEKYLKSVEHFQNPGQSNADVKKLEEENEEVVENIQKHAALDTVLDNVIKEETDEVQEEEQEDEPNLAEDRVEERLDNLQIDV